MKVWFKPFARPIVKYLNKREMKYKEKYKKDHLKQNPFRVPENYFDQFSEKLMQRIDAEQPVSKGNKLIRILKPTLAMAASFAAIFMIVYFTVNGSNQKYSENTESIDELEYLNLVITDDSELISTINDANENEVYYDKEDVESYLLASVSDYELYNF